MTEEMKEEENNVGISFKKSYEELEKENEQLKKQLEETEKQWKSCFLSCSSPYCAGHFPAVKMEGELGNMSKHE